MPVGSRFSMSNFSPNHASAALLFLEKWVQSVQRVLYLGMRMPCSVDACHHDDAVHCMSCHRGGAWWQLDTWAVMNVLHLSNWYFEH
jgi:hypothetical protein